MTYNITYLAIYVVTLKDCNVHYILPYKQQKVTLHQETMLCIAFHSCLSIIDI